MIRIAAALTLLALVGCGGDDGDDGDDLLAIPLDAPPAGNPEGTCEVPAEATAADTSAPDHVVGDGTAASCTSDAFIAAVEQGGVITFDCGPDPVLIRLDRTAKIFNDTGPEIVIDGGGTVALGGRADHRILYMNTCDPAQRWTTDHCQNQDHPRLTVQNLTFVDGDASGEDDGGGAIFARGGRLKIVNSRFFRSRCARTGPDVGGAAVRVLSQFQPDGAAEPLPVYVVGSTFGGSAELANTCSNGGGLSSIGVSHTVINSLFSHNSAVGNGANPPQSGTPGGGSGAAIYNDGNTFTLRLCGVAMTDNDANEGGGAIFFVSNDDTGHLVIDRSTLRRNPSRGFETLPGIFVKTGPAPAITDSVIE
jgi:hypothetical protein